MKELLESLRAFDALRDAGPSGPVDLVELRETPGRPPTYAPQDTVLALPARIQAVLRECGFSHLYEHQTEAIGLALDGQDVVLEAPTASGKTLSFALPMLQLLADQPNAHALMLYPMKAVANDQRGQVEALIRHFPRTSRPLESWPYDGDASDVDRKALRERPPAILMTNPEMMHLSFLGSSHLWENFLRNLRFIVIDEIHEYRGYFGTNFALLLRRFLLKLNRYGCRPQLFLATATCANPVEHALNLTGRNCRLVSAKNKMGAPRSYAFVRPGIPDYRFHEIFELRIARAALACLSRGLATIVFCPSRMFTEGVFRKAKREAEKLGLDPALIVPYRAGFKSEERREIEGKLKSGEHKVVFCTNALELGIDIGQLDTCILAGFPDSVMSAWQRIGRAGRYWDKSAYVLFYAMNNAVDQFYAENIDAFLSKPLDEIAIGLSNDELMLRHTPYLLHETDWELAEADKPVLGETFWAFAKEKSANLKPVGGRGPNYARLSLRGGPAGSSRLLYHGNEIGSISEAQLFQEAYVGAVYNHLGRSYRVTGHGTAEVYLEEAPAHLRTQPLFHWVPYVSDTLFGKRYAQALSVFYGKISIFQNFTGYRVIDDRTGELIDEELANLTRTHNAHAFWLVLDQESVAPPELDLSTGTRGMEHLFRIGSTFVIPCDRHDTNTFSSPKRPRTIYFYENVPGGIGIAQKAYDLWPEILQEGAKIAEKCPCEDGCPRCIYPPRLRDKDAQTVSKRTGMALAGILLKIGEGLPDEEFDPDTYGWRPASTTPIRRTPQSYYRPDEVARPDLHRPEVPIIHTDADVTSETNPPNVQGGSTKDRLATFSEWCRVEANKLTMWQRIDEEAGPRQPAEEAAAVESRRCTIASVLCSAEELARQCGLTARVSLLSMTRTMNDVRPLSWAAAVELLEQCGDFQATRQKPAPTPSGSTATKLREQPKGTRKTSDSGDLQRLAEAVLDVLQNNRGRQFSARELALMMPVGVADLAQDSVSGQSYISQAVAILREQGHPIPKGSYVLPS